MNRWLWYLGWLLAWFIAFAFIVVPLSNLLAAGGAASGGLRGLILAAAWLILFVGIGLIYRKLRTSAPADAATVGHSARGAAHGMSDREATLVAMAREEAFGNGPGLPGGMPAQRPPSARDPAVATTNVPSGSATGGTVQPPPAGVMKSAGNPLVRSAFAQAMKEVDTGDREPGLWAMALVECNGDEKAARIAYMRARAADIAWEHTRSAVSARDVSPRKPR